MNSAGEPFELAWLNALLYASSDASRNAIRLKASGERYAAASMRAALEMNEALKDEGNRTSFDIACAAVLAQPAQAMPAFVRAVPFLLEAERFSAPNGMFDLPHIISTAFFVPKAATGFDVDMHKTLLRLFSVVLIRVQTGFLDKSIETNREGFIAGLANVGTWEMPERIKLRYEDTGRDLLPSPAAVIVALGGDPMVAIADSVGFHKFVGALNDTLWLRSGSSTIWSEGHASPRDEMMVRYLWHMRVFLSDSAERLALSVLTCDRVPIVAPWYGMTILAARAYAMGVYSALANNSAPAEPVAFSAFSLIAMAAGDSAGKLPSPARTLFDAGTKSMYLRSEAQDGPYWVMLRATLSGLRPEQATGVAQILCSIESASPVVCATAVMLCALMRTQAGMVIFSHRTSGSNAAELASYPLASKAAGLVDAARGQTIFDFVMSTISGTLDLEMLASDDLAFTTPQRIVEMWRGGAAAADAVAKDTARIDIVEGWCKAMNAVGTAWSAQLLSGAVFALETSSPTVRSITAVECRDSLDRVSASHATLNHGKWLAIAFKFACLAEEAHAATGPPLIKSHIDLNAPNSRAMAPDLNADNAWLRLNFRQQAEQVLHSGRRGGMFTAGNHLVLCAWIVVHTSMPGDNGVRVFARALTTHTVDAADKKARLLSDAWRATTERRGDDSVVATALEFERHLNDYNVIEHNTYWPERESARIKALEVLPKDESTPTEPLLPYVPTTSRAAQMAAATAEGPTKFDGDKVQDLDAATSAALNRWRKAATNQAMTNSLFVCQTPFEHGVSMALISSPAQTQEDLRPACEAKLAVQTWKTAEDQRAALLKRLRDFQRGAGPEGKK